MVGDVDGDGLDDVATWFDAYDPTFPGGVYVVFGGTLRAGPFPAGDMGEAGLRITGGFTPRAVAGVGDVDGDGRDDVAVAGYDGVKVVLGRDAGTVDVSEPGDWGFAFTGIEVYDRDGLVGLGDQDGDGRRDLAASDGYGGARVLYSPQEVRGSQTDAHATGYALTVDLGSYVSLTAMGDQDGDGREDLGVFHEDGAGIVHGYVVRTQAPGTSLALAGAADAGEAFEVWADDPPNDPEPDWDLQLEHGTSLGDQDGDGRRELALTVYNDTRWLLVPFSGRMGERRDISQLVDQDGYRLHVYYGDVKDPGDVDGDGRGDIADSNFLRLTDERVFDGDQETGGSMSAFSYGGEVTGAVRDRSEDGRREVVTVSDVRTDDDAGHHGRYSHDVWYSSSAPRIVHVGGRLEIGRYIAGPGSPLVDGGYLTIGVRVAGGDAENMYVTVKPSWEENIEYSGQTWREGDDTLASIGLGWVPNGSYSVRVTATDWRRGLGTWSGVVPVVRVGNELPPHVPFEMPRKPDRVQKGTHGDDVLRGTYRKDLIRGRGGDDLITGVAATDALYGETGHDRIRGGGGNDTLQGDEGRDRITGGRGLDRVWAGPGRDVVRVRDGGRDVVSCGPGRDRVVADRNDVVSRCEVVRRPPVSPPRANR